MFTTTKWAPVLACLLALAAAPARAAERPREVPLWPLPGGVADPEQAVGYVANFQHGIDGVNLQNGKTVAATGGGGAPVAVAGGQVLVLAPDPRRPNVATVHALDLRTGRLDWRSTPVALPGWVVMAPAPGRHFGTRARLAEGQLWVKWQAWAWKPGVRKPAVRTAAGVIRVALDAQRADLLPAARMPPPAVPRGVSPRLAKLAARDIATPAGPERVVATAGKLAVAVDVGPGGVVLRRWDLRTEKALAPLTLAQRGPLLATPFPAAGAVLVRPDFQRLKAARGQVFQVFSLGTGKRVAQLPVEAEAMEATILGPRLYYAYLGPLSGLPAASELTPRVRQMKAVDLRTGAVLWSHLLEKLPWDPYASGCHCCCCNP
jgi:hypothetical protein